MVADLEEIAGLTSRLNLVVEVGGASGVRGSKGTVADRESNLVI